LVSDVTNASGIVKPLGAARKQKAGFISRSFSEARSIRRRFGKSLGIKAQYSSSLKKGLLVSLLYRVGWLGFSRNKSTSFGSAYFRNAVGFAFPFIPLLLLGLRRV
jgi:hypothetical protein